MSTLLLDAGVDGFRAMWHRVAIAIAEFRLMAFDPSKLVPATLLADIEVALKAAYEQGRADAVAAIISAANGPLPEQPDTRGPSRRPGSLTEKAPRGLVQEIVGRVVADKPGLSISDYEDMALDLESRISRKSVGNEFRRGEGTRYERDRPGGYRWYPKGHKTEAAENPDEEKSAASLFNKEEANAAALVN